MIVSKHIVPAVLAAVLALAALQPALAADMLYRYTNNDGVLEVSKIIPPAYVKHGYEVVDKNGIVIRTVEPQLSAEAYALHQAEMETKRAYAAAVRRVYTLYASEDDIYMAEQTRVASIERTIAEAKGDIARLQNEKSRLEEQAAMQERSGRSTPAETIRYLNALDRRLDDREREVKKRLEEIEQARRQFEADRALFREVVESRYDARR